jgi:hypothetical protein
MKCVTIGPRGGLGSSDVSCHTCICANKCAFSGPNTMALGCHDWVGTDGHRMPSATHRAPEDTELSPEAAEIRDWAKERAEHAFHALIPDKDESDHTCDCGDPDCSRPLGHQEEDPNGQPES